MNPQSNSPPRVGPDPRQQPTSIWDTIFGRGQRMRHRRALDQQSAYYVDRFSAVVFLLILALLAFTFLDGILTLELVEANCGEFNPVMGYLLSKGPAPFLLGKYVLTAGGLPILLIFKNHRFFGTSFRVGYFIPVFVLCYLGLITYQLLLLHQLQKGP